MSCTNKSVVEDTHLYFEAYLLRWPECSSLYKDLRLFTREILTLANYITDYQGRAYTLRVQRPIVTVVTIGAKYAQDIELAK